MFSSMESGRSQETKIIDKIFSAAQAGTVFSQPVTIGDYTVITASEVTAGGGFGSGIGFGPTAAGKSREQPGLETAESKDTAAMGGGSGMGAGGGSAGRPVAIITLRPDGVKIEPVLDVTKIALAALTAWGAMMIALLRMRKVAKS
jgi:uncharacterized spore protein YtfJ